MNSCLYPMDIMHHRLAPKRHRFVHSTFMFYLDFAEIDEVARRLWPLGHNRLSAYEFRDRDHMNFGGATVRDNVLAFLKQNGCRDAIGRMMLLTNLRTFGYLFNPVSFYFCFDKEGQPAAVIPEIGNTFGEIKPYFLGKDHFQNGLFRRIAKKYFYISPFVDLDVSLDFQIRVPGEHLDIRIDDLKEERKLLLSSMMGKREPLTTGTLWKYSLRVPWVTLKVITLIHWHALLLWLKRIPYHPKEDNLHLQKEVQNVFYHVPTRCGSAAESISGIGTNDRNP